jgi:IS5 family transposase
MRDKQTTFADAGFEQYRKTTRWAQFLADMDRAVPWSTLVAVIEPHCPNRAGAGRPPAGLERMLRIHFLQQRFNLSDPAVEDALYDPSSMRAFVSIDLGREPVPDETTVCKSRRLLERHQLGPKLFEAVNAHLKRQGFKVTTGTIVDATFIGAPSSTKDASGQRDPERRQSKRRDQWHFGMKAHIGMDSKHKLIHSVVASPANSRDARALPHVLHGRETRVWGDSAYSSQTDTIRERAYAQDFTNRSRGKAWDFTTP